ncbi:MAG: shikimate dehydrogenase [Gemmataceae bacterium]
MAFADVDRVCVVIGRTRHKMIVAELAEATKRGAKFIELRIDFLAKAVEFKRLVEQKQTPWVATIRRPADGGRWAGTETERQTVIRQAIVANCFEWVDLETDIADTIRRFGTVRRLVSYHNMQETPANLDAIYEKMCGQDADVVKIAVMPRTPSDVQRIIELQRRAEKPTIAIAMGELGFLTRFTTLKYGAPWTYAAFNKERGIAPGLPSFEDFKTTYPVRSINRQTQFFAVVGDPVSHSFSPLLHNHMYLRTKTNAFYAPIRTNRGTLAELINALVEVPLDGLSVTIPLKEEAAALAAEKEPFVGLSGAANTLVRRPNGEYFAANSDSIAVIESLESHLKASAGENPPVELSQLSFLLLGSGGVARAIAHALHEKGVQLTIAARNHEKAIRLAEEVRCKVIDWHARNATRFDVLINGTPVGMHPNLNEMPVHVSALQPGQIVFDTVYTPETTMLIREAKSRGCQVITGVEMFVRQAARQFEVFTGVAPDINKMREIMRKALLPLSKILEEETADATGTAPPAPEGDPEQ